jgi:TATA-box binding protein (TBP) (component of TFIID and TFIIIB)
MTICLDMIQGCTFECYNIGKFLKINTKIIQEIKFSDENNEIKIRGQSKKKIRNKRKKKNSGKSRKDSFYNQVTIIVKISETKTINIKLFKNGSIQMTGCNSIENAQKSIETIFNILSKPRYILDFGKKEIKEVNFVTFENKKENKKENKELELKDIVDGTIVLINCNFNIGFEINRDKLYEIISNKKNDSILEIKKHDVHLNQDIDIPQKYMDCTYDPIRHACVNIKLNHPTKTITIFVFESGSIIILGKTCRQVRDAYNFINVILLINYFNVCCKNN